MGIEPSPWPWVNKKLMSFGKNLGFFLWRAMGNPL